jgi:hypothetical protein
MPLTDLQVQQYAETGYLVLEAVIADERLTRYRQIFDELVERSRSLTESRDGFNLAPDEQGAPIPGRLHKVQGVCVVDERVLDLAREPEILDRVESLIGPNIDMFGSKFYPMLVRGATSTGWHQDNHYFGTDSERVVSCAIYLEAGEARIGREADSAGGRTPGRRRTAASRWCQAATARAASWPITPEPESTPTAHGPRWTSAGR